MSRLKVSLVLPDLPHGGVERSTLGLSRYLVDVGHKVTLVLLKDRGELRSSVPSGVTVRALEQPLPLDRVSIIRAAVALRRMLQDTAPDVVVAAKERANIAAVLACSTINRRPRLILSRHVPLFGTPRSVAGIFTQLLYRTVYSQANAIVGVSQGLSEQIRKLAPRSYHEKIYHIPNPVIDSEFFERARMPLERDWPTSGFFCFICVARLTREKGVHLLLNALSRTGEQASRLIIVGDGDCRLELEKQAGDMGIAQRVSFMGALANPLPLVARADCLVLPSLYEGLGNVLIEALALGTPVIAFDCPVGPREITKSGALGTLVPPGDVTQLASAMAEASRGNTRLGIGFDAAAYTDLHAGAAYEQLMYEIKERS